MIFPRWRGHHRTPRERMIAETSAFLNWALENHVPLPRIPSRPVRHGGFGRILQTPAGRAAARHWWARTFEALDRMGH